MARTYNESKAVFLAGPIEWWWDTEADPNRFMSDEARWYRHHREAVAKWFADNHYLVYRPHHAFKGDWNEKMQPVNDYVLGLCDIVVNMKPNDPRIIANGTEHEWELAKELNKVRIYLPPLPMPEETYYLERMDTFTPGIIEMILETARLTGQF